MSPVEARLFTMEARLRSEENKRIHIYEELHEIAEGLKHLKLPSKERTRSESPNSLEVRAKLEGFKNVENRRMKQEKNKNFTTLYNLSSSPSSMTSERIPDLDSTSPSFNIMAFKYEKPKMNQRYTHASPIKARLPAVKTASPHKRTKTTYPQNVPSSSYTPVRYKVMDLDEEPMFLSKRAV